MTQPAETFAQGSSNASQIELRTIQVQTLVNGILQNVQLEVATISDPVTGRILDMEGSEYRDEVTRLLRRLVKGIEALCVAMDVEADFEDQQQVDE